jgi:hypothetical protein
MRNAKWLVVLGLGSLLAWAPAQAQRPYIGFVYPAGGQQGTTYQIRLGGQGMDDVTQVVVSGPGVTARIVEYNRRMNNQEQALLGEQLRELKRAKKSATQAKPQAPAADMIMMAAAAAAKTDTTTWVAAQDVMISRLEKRIDDFIATPACASISTLLYVEVTISPDAPPGEREIRVVTLRGVSNPLAFHIGQVPEYTRKAMRTATIQVLGKEVQSLRKRPPEEAVDRVDIPCTVNGQIASGEMNEYRFAAREGQRLVLTTLARQLIPYIADAVPGWFQPVMVLYDADGKEVAYDDDYRFKPDPVIFYTVPKSGDYVLAIYDAIYRGREDFVYRITVGELPFVTSIFPLGGRAGEPAALQMKGWNVAGAELPPPSINTPAGVTTLAAHKGRFVSNRVPFMLDTLPECFEKEPNNTLSRAQKVTLPVIINGRIDKPDDWDVFQFAGKAGETVVAEVYARRLDSPLDSMLKLTDADGKLLAFNDDCEDLGSGLNTHHADSYLRARLPADGKYYVHIGDTTRKGGEEYTYRLRISAPRPDFALRVVPSSISLRSKGTASLTVYAFRKDGFTNTVKLVLKDPPPGFSALPVLLTGTQMVKTLTFKADLLETKRPVNLTIEGRAQVGAEEVVHAAVPAEDRMQAFLWRHLVPAQELSVLVYDPATVLPPKRVAPVRPPPPVVTNAVVVAVSTNAAGVVSNAVAVATGKFTRQQVASRLRELQRLYEEGWLLDDFYNKRVDECEANIDNTPPPPVTPPSKPKIK